MKLFEMYIALLICLVQVHDSVCTHFRGGTFTYTPVDPSNPANLRVSSQDEIVITMSTVDGNDNSLLIYCRNPRTHQVFSKRNNAKNGLFLTFLPSLNDISLTS